MRKSGRVFGQGQKRAKMARAGLYARVSTQDQQTLPMQNRAMREYAARRGSEWSRTLNISGGNIHLNAELEPCPVPSCYNSLTHLSI